MAFLFTGGYKALPSKDDEHHVLSVLQFDMSCVLEAHVLLPKKTFIDKQSGMGAKIYLLQRGLKMGDVIFLMSRQVASKAQGSTARHLACCWLLSVRLQPEEDRWTIGT